MQAIDDLRQFHEFVGRQLQTLGEAMTPEQCLKAWRSRHPSESESAESVAELKAAIKEMEEGDLGVPAREYLRKQRHVNDGTSANCSVSKPREPEIYQRF